MNNDQITTTPTGRRRTNGRYQKGRYQSKCGHRQESNVAFYGETSTAEFRHKCNLFLQSRSLPTGLYNV